MKTHFASTLYAVRQMNPHVTVPAVVPGSSSPAPILTRAMADKPKPLVERDARRIMVLPEGQTLTIVTADGRPLVEIASGEKGPEIRLAHDDLRIECPGRLDLAAQQITMAAHDDVVLQGKTIRLN